MKKETQNTQDMLLLYLGRLEGKVDAILTNQKQLDGRLNQLGSRTMKLELYRAWQLGACGVIASVIAWATSYIMSGQ